MNALLKSPGTTVTPVTRGYRNQHRVNANTLRLRAVVKLFRLSPNQVAKATGFSRPYVARLLSAKDNFQGSSEFYRTLEQKLGTIIDQRSTQFFTVSAVSVQMARNILEGLPDQMADVATVERVVDRLFPEVKQAAYKEARRSALKPWRTNKNVIRQVLLIIFSGD